MTPGYKTTEFWLSLACAVMAGALGYLETLSATWAVVAVAIISCVYTIMRNALKARQDPK